MDCAGERIDDSPVSPGPWLDRAPERREEARRNSQPVDRCVRCLADYLLLLRFARSGFNVRWKTYSAPSVAFLMAASRTGVIPDCPVVVAVDASVPVNR